MIKRSGTSFKNLNKVPVLLFAAYLAVLGLILFRYPLNDSFFGNIDMWLTVWQMNDFYQALTGTELFGQVMYPARDLSALIDSPVGLGWMYSPLKFVIRNDIWVFYALTVLVLALNATGFMMVLRGLKINVWIAALFGLMFATSNFTMSQLENFNSIALFPMLFSLYFLIRAGESDEAWKFSILAGILAGIQLYFSIYLFVFQFVLLIPVAIAMKLYKPVARPAASLFLIALLVIPFIFNHRAMPHHIADALLKSMMPVNEEYSISLFLDYFRMNDGNLLYRGPAPLDNEWHDNARSAFFGFSSYLLLLTSLIYFFRRRSRLIVGLLVVLAVSVLISSGPVLTLMTMKVLSPVGWINKLLPGTLLLRHLFRIHHLVILAALTIIALFFQAGYARRPQSVLYAVLAFTAIYMMENIPFNSSLYASEKHLAVPDELVTLLDQVPPGKNLMFLPACTMVITEEELEMELIPIAREYVYMLWKQDLPFNVYNGRMAYLSDYGFRNNMNLCYLGKERFNQLEEENDIDYFVVVREFAARGFLTDDLPVIAAGTDLIEDSGNFMLLKSRPLSANE